jgi:hypothetical protein
MNSPITVAQQILPLGAIVLVLCFQLLACASRSYPPTYEADAMLVDVHSPSVGHLYDAYGRYLSSGEFIDACAGQPILEQTDQALARCRFKTKFSIYPAGLSAIQSKVARARGVSGSAALTTPTAVMSPTPVPLEAPSPVSETLAAVKPADLPKAHRLALVIGNSNYRSIPHLENPHNDAQLVARTLAALGFRLVRGQALLDLGRAELEQAVAEFSEQLHRLSVPDDQLDASDRPMSKGVVSLFYDAGHGVQERGENYLVPVDANPSRLADFDLQMLNVNVVLRQMESAGTMLNMVVLDACRNSPFGGRGLRSTGTGLAEMKAPEGTLIAFATQSGNVAQDGPAGGNSPFAQAFAWGIRQPGLDQFGAFNSVAVKVKKITGGAQQPWMSNSPIEGRFFFVNAPAE